MNPIKRKRMTRRNRQRAMLLGIGLSAVASTAGAGTHGNPYFPSTESSHAVAVVSNTTDTVQPSERGPVSTTVSTPRRLPPVNSPVVLESEPELPAASTPPEPQRAIPAAATLPQVPVHDAEASRWLQSITPESCLDRAARHLDDAYREYSVGAWSSAESSAWTALELTATGIDIADSQNAVPEQPITAAADMRVARTAIREARDFVASGAAVDAEMIAAIASSHQTPAAAGMSSNGLTPPQLADRYLDFARVKLAPLAARQVQAAQAMDLIAAIQLGRDETNSLPEETALCLRRAALQGQPSNASLATRLGMQLADMGLDAEAQWTLRHAMTLAPTAEVASALDALMARGKAAVGGVSPDLPSTQPGIRPTAPVVAEQRLPQVIELSPAQFATISPAVNTLVRPAAEVPDQRQPVAVQRAVPVETKPERSAKKASRFIPASLAGFRLPLIGAKANSAEDSATDSRRIESTVDPAFSVDEFQPYDASTAASPTASADQQGSAMKRFLGKFPKLW